MRNVLLAARGLVFGLVILVFAPAARAVCPGDCDGNGSVAIGELVKGVNMALGQAALSQCPAFNTNNDQMVSVSELIAAVNAALKGCPPETETPATATPTMGTPAATPSVTPTPTLSIEPIFPADYRNSFVEVRDCRLGIEHRTRMIRVLANPIAAEPYQRLENPLPVGSIVIKEEYDGLDCSNDAELVSWSVMRKESPGFDPEDGDWHWQYVNAPDRTVTCNDKHCPGFSCVTACHSNSECVARDYMCTVNDMPRGTLHAVLEDLPAAVLSIAGRSSTDVYTVGGDASDGHGPLVLHYNGTQWKRLDSGVSSGALWWISVTPIDGDFYMAGENGVILQFDPGNGQFTRHTTPDSTTTLFGIWGVSATNLWAVGGNSENQAVVWHYDGQMWTAQDVAAVVPSGVPTTLNKVWGTSASDVYAVGETGIILHYEGSGWSLVPSTTDNSLFTIHGNGSIVAAVGGFQVGRIVEKDGTNPFVARAPSTAPRMNGIFVPPSGDAIAVGVNLAVVARSASGWATVDEGSDPNLRDFHGVWIDPDDGIWAVGGRLDQLSNGILSYGGTQSVPGGPIE